ncbi:hypothetical protein SAMN05444722_1615 [Rhodovulum sp. ES.010]|uniref:hypothetical protein n=1 Tax=Rhodovulum sp. ES.010 TaxID=1882821 RepID=UPI000925D0EB|nr:hypothetical protein [Rhodovulum sp. ES.010]SIO35317.1 hypothetical protein SAMN05444722_1615 [Rhodovulum sp. ES.010]
MADRVQSGALIRLKRVRNVERHLGGVAEGAEFRLLVRIAPEDATRLARAGFDETLLQDGDAVLPAAIGPATRLNAEGRWQVRRDLPKESRYITTVMWRRMQWAGRDREEHESAVDIHRMCYPRELVPPTGFELSWRTQDGQAFVLSPKFQRKPAALDDIRIAMNVVLELFGRFELIDAGFEWIPPAPMRRVNWRMLPAGAHPWPRLEEHLADALRRTPDRVSAVIMDRQKEIVSQGPDLMYVGVGGFSDYIAYELRNCGVVVLESIRRGNALYVFGDDWRTVSSMTKAEVLAGNLHLERIIHSEGWKARLNKALRIRRAA